MARKTNRRAAAAACIPNESDEQEIYFRYCGVEKNRYPELFMLHHIPNGGSRHKAEAARLKMQGVRKGVPDISLPVPKGKYHGMYIELKRRSGGTVSSDQKTWLKNLNKYGYAAAVCQGFDEAWEFTKAYLKNDVETLDKYISRTLKRWA